MSDSCTTQGRTPSEKTECGPSVSTAESVIKKLGAQVEMEKIRARMCSKRLSKALCDYEIATDPLLFKRRAQWVAEQHGVPSSRVYRLRRRIREAL